MAAKPRYDPLDPRQRLAAALLMSAVDLPQPVVEFSKLCLIASKLSPGCSVKDIQLGQGRRVGLLRARQLIDELLAEEN